MAKVIHKGINPETGLIDAEIKRTPVLITELIHDLPKLSERETQKRLCEIRESAERDQNIARIYVETINSLSPRKGEPSPEKPAVGAPHFARSGGPGDRRGGERKK